MVDMLSGFAPAAGDRLKYLLLLAEGRQSVMSRLIADKRVEQAAALTAQTIADSRSYAAEPGANVLQVANDLSQLSDQLSNVARYADAVTADQAMVDMLSGFVPAAGDRLKYLLLLAEARQSVMSRLIADKRVEQAAALTAQTVADYRSYAAEPGANVPLVKQELSSLADQLASAGRSAEAAMVKQAIAALG
jgi:hypothetical protein